MTPEHWNCGQFEGVLSEYREGTLDPSLAALARRHVASCPTCTALVEAVAAVQAQVAALPALEPPAHLVAHIVALTLPHRPLRPGSRPRAVRRTGLAAFWDSILSPRFALGVAMSVFAIALLLNAAQINLGQLLRSGDMSQLSPAGLTSAITRHVNRAWARGVTYYHDLRVVYEIEAAIHQMRQSSPPAGSSGSGHNRSDRAAGPHAELARIHPPRIAWRTLP